jgi:hypothetical protein
VCVCVWMHVCMYEKHRLAYCRVQSLKRQGNGWMHA